MWSLLCCFNPTSRWACQDQTSGCYCSTRCLLNRQLLARRKRMGRSRRRWRGGEGARFVSHSLAVTRRQRGFVLAVEWAGACAVCFISPAVGTHFQSFREWLAQKENSGKWQTSFTTSQLIQNTGLCLDVINYFCICVQGRCPRCTHYRTVPVSSCMSV